MEKENNYIETIVLKADRSSHWKGTDKILINFLKYE